MWNINLISFLFLLDCEHHIFDTKTTIHSPHFPEKYDSDTDLKWVFHAKAEHCVELTIHDFNTEENKDLVTVDIGDDMKYMLSGNKVYKRRIYSRSNMMSVSFKSDHSYNYRGFKATFKQIEKGSSYFWFKQQLHYFLFKMNAMEDLISLKIQMMVKEFT